MDGLPAVGAIKRSAAFVRADFIRPLSRMTLVSSPHTRPWRDAALATASVLLVALIGLGLSYRAARVAQIEAVQNELQQLAATLAVQIDGDLHRTIRSEAQSGTPDHLRALEPIGRFLNSAKDIIYAYTAVLRGDEIRFVLNGSFVFRIPEDPLPPDEINELYDGPDVEFRQALVEQRATVNARIVHESPGRSYMSAYAPFRDSKGEFVGVVGVDMWTRDLEQRLARMARAVFVSGLAVAVLAVAVGFIVYRLRCDADLHDRALKQALAETRAAREAAEKADALKTRLVGVASHDLKSPLRAVVSASAAIAREPTDTAAVVELARRMHSEGQRMFALIRDLLDVAALETGHLELQRRPLAPASLAREVAAALQDRARAKDQMLDCSIAPGAEERLISGDHGRLRQVLENLVDNALKFTPAGRAIRVSVDDEAGMVRVAVADEGPGLSPEDYAALFQPFQKLSAVPTGGESSSGLGLFIVRELVSAHGGQLLVDSMPGEGATFAVLLPVIASE
jgi:signal transduction histidine kinase